MKPLPLLLLSVLPAFAQTQVRVTADCVIGFTFTASGSTTVTPGNANAGDNRQAGCESWTLQYQSVGFSAVSLTIQSAPGSLTPGSFVTYAGTIDAGINPNTSTTGATTTGHNGTATIPWIRVNAVLTGSGTLNGVLYGIKSGPTVNITGTITPTGTQDVNLTEIDGVAAATAAAGVLKVGTVGSTGSAFDSAPGAAAPAHSISVEGTFNTSPPTLTNGQAGALQLDSGQNLKVVAQTPLPGSSTFNAGQQAVTGTAAALPTHAANGVCVKALIANTINVYVGPAAVTTSGATGGVELPPGQGTCAPLTNSNLMFVIASTTGASVSWWLTD